MSMKSKIFAVVDIKSEELHIPEWDVTLEIREMSGEERGEFLASVMTETGEPNMRRFYAMMAIATCYDPTTGEKVFEEGDFEALNAKNGAILERISNVASRLSALDKKAQDELGKDSSSTVSADSTSS